MEGPACTHGANQINDTDEDGKADRLLRKAETILKTRTDRILLVLERCTDNQNYLACLRTAESIGAPGLGCCLSVQ